MHLNQHTSESLSTSPIYEPTHVFSEKIHDVLQENEIFPGITSYDLARGIGNLFYDAL